MASENDIPERDQRVANLLRSAAQTERAPQSLHAHVAALREQPRSRRRRSLLRRPTFFAMPTAAAIAAGLIVALGGSAGAPSLAQAAALATKAPTAPAPASDASDPAKLLSAKVGTLHFPNWRAAGGWRAVGERKDQIGNRTATTVYYAVGSNRVAYSIVSSPALKSTAGLEPLSSTTQYYRVLVSGGRTTVIWTESGHTCLLTGQRGMSAAKLWGLASFGFRRAL